MQRPPGIDVAQVEPTEQFASVVHASPAVRAEAVLQVPVSHTRPVPHCESDVHREGPESSEHAHTPAAATIAARVRIRTVPSRWAASSRITRHPDPGGS